MTQAPLYRTPGFAWAVLRSLPWLIPAFILLPVYLAFRGLYALLWRWPRDYWQREYADFWEPTLPVDDPYDD